MGFVFEMMMLGYVLQYKEWELTLIVVPIFGDHDRQSSVCVFKSDEIDKYKEKQRHGEATSPAVYCNAFVQFDIIKIFKYFFVYFPGYR